MNSIPYSLRSKCGDGFARRLFRTAAAGLGVLAACQQGASAAPPRYDHVVIVIEENRTLTQILGDLVNAPYINSLAAGGVQLSSMFGLEHPSQPNYLQLFSGSDQGVTNDSLPPGFSVTPTATYPFRTANLGAEILDAGFTFAGFSEELETAGTGDWADYDPHTASHPGISYRRKHNPWANWVAKTNPIPAFQLPASVNRAFTQFPKDFAQLPTVSFVIPTQDHDMHDGSRKEGDDWLKANLGDYAAWARTNNSLLIITWDEDDSNEDNRIPTVFYGAGLRNGSVVRGTWTHHNMLRTLEEMYGTATHAGSAAQVRPIVGPFVGDPVLKIATFRQGLNGYTNAHDTEILEELPTTNLGAAQNLTMDLDTSGTLSGNQSALALVRFDALIGTSATQIPSNAIIHSAKLLLFTPSNTTNSSYNSDDFFRLHRMLVDWKDDSTWSSLGGGVAADGVKAAQTATFSVLPDVDGAPAILDVTSDIELFRLGTTNRGWILRPSTSGKGDGWRIKSSETTGDLTQRPTLEVVYSLPLTPYQAWAQAHGLAPQNQDPSANPDHDSENNLGEFAFNLDPLTADSTPLGDSDLRGIPSVRRVSLNGSDLLELQFLRRLGPTAVGLDYSVSFSSDLVSWVAGKPPSQEILNADWERVRVMDSLPLSDHARFARVMVTLQP